MRMEYSAMETRKGLLTPARLERQDRQEKDEGGAGKLLRGEREEGDIGAAGVDALDTVSTGYTGRLAAAVSPQQYIVLGQFRRLRGDLDPRFHGPSGSFYLCLALTRS